MSFHIRDDFKAGAPVSQVPASWFNAVGGFINRIVGGFGIRTPRSDSGKMEIALDKEVLQREIDNAVANIRVSKDPGSSPIDMTDSPAVLDTAGASATWEPGTANGLNIDCYCKIAPQSSGAVYTVYQRTRLSFSKDGLLVKAQLLSDRIRVQAKNA